MNRRHTLEALMAACALPLELVAHDAGLPAIIAEVKQSVVGVGTSLATRRPPNELSGTGFVVGDGSLVVTNNHVLPDPSKLAPKEQVAAFVPNGAGGGELRSVKVLRTDRDHDLALLKIAGSPLRPVGLAGDDLMVDGTAIAITGFPIGAVLGLTAATHAGIVAAVTPIAIPARNSRELTIKQVKALRNPFNVYQLDVVAYPGNSGSPVYRADTGEVIAVINKVFVKETKENLLSDPSGISYAIPVQYVRRLLNG